MSELKVHRFITTDELFPEANAGALYYDKSEADKVIAEKDKEIQRLENLCESYRIDCDNLAIREANAYKEIERDNKQLRHQKYKRCLAMADKCAEAYNRECGLNPEEMTDKEFYKQQIEFWPRWNSKWLKIGEKFKDGV